MDNNKKQENGVIIFAKKILGVLLIITGVIGLFLPFLQGIAMILLGVFLLGGKPAVRKCKKWAVKMGGFLRRIWNQR